MAVVVSVLLVMSGWLLHRRGLAALSRAPVDRR